VEIFLSERSKKELVYWSQINKKIYFRIIILMEDIQKNPFTGLGLLEPLKYYGANTWSRRINKEHRLIYRIQEQKIKILSVRGHYD